MDWKKEWKILTIFGLVFLAFFYMPLGVNRFDNAIFEALYLTQWYARHHVILCLIPAFFIAGGIAVFISQQSVMKYLGAQANKFVAYAVASVSGGILAVCSCTILPLFAGIYRMGAGLGPAVTFLYSGPAINVMAIVLTANVLGLKLGLARAIGAIVFSVVIGIIMEFVFKKEEKDKIQNQNMDLMEEESRPLWQTTIYFGLMVAILVFANWGKPDRAEGFFYFLYSYKWILTSVSAVLLGVVLVMWFEIKLIHLALASLPPLIFAIVLPQYPELAFISAVVGISILIARGNEQNQSWFEETWGFAKQILPLLFYGVLVAGFLLGRPGHAGIIPEQWITASVGGNSVFANLFASVVGAFMYFATLTEVPILQGLLGNGMGQGPALALLLAGPALSLPNMLVIKSVMGWKKTLVYVALVVIMSTITGLIYGAYV